MIDTANVLAALEAGAICGALLAVALVAVAVILYTVRDIIASLSQDDD